MSTDPPRPPALARSFLPTWLAVAGIVALHMASLGLLQTSPRTRAPAWSPDASGLVAIVIVTAVGAWAFPASRATAWLVGAMCTVILAMHHAITPFHAPVPPPVELLAFYATGATLLAVGAREWARSGADPA